MNKMSKVLMFVYVFVLVVSIVSTARADNITPTMPDIGANFRDVMTGGGKLITIMFNIFAVLFVGTAGFASVQLVSGMLQQNPMQINHARSAIFASFIGLAGLALIPKLAGIILSTFGFQLQ